MVGWHHRLSGQEFEQALGDSGGQGSLACCSPWGLRVRHDLGTEQQEQIHTHTHTHIYNVFFMHESINGHLSCFPVLAIVKNCLSKHGGVVQFLSCVWLFLTPWTAACQLLYHPLSPRVCSNSCPLSQWCYLTISSSATLFPICLWSFRALGYFPRSQLFVSGGQCTGVSASATVLQWVFRIDFL